MADNAKTPAARTASTANVTSASDEISSSDNTTSARETILVTFNNGGVNHRRVISASDWKGMGVDLRQTVWERRNNWTLDATDWPPAAFKYFERDSAFKVERHSG